MKKLITIVLLSAFYINANSQTINAGSEEFGKIRKDGLYMNIPIEKKQIEKDWFQYLNNYGDVEKTKDGLTMPKANIKNVSEYPILIQSKITGASNKTTIFWALDLGNNQFVTANSKEFKEVEVIMQNFYVLSMKKEEIRLVEKDLDEANKNLERVTKTTEKLKRDTDRNTKELETLTKKLEENKLQTAQNLKDKEQNLKDIEAAKLTVKEKSAAVEKVKQTIK
jgi:hypothetical protein